MSKKKSRGLQIKILLYLIEKVGTEAGVAPEPLVSAVLTTFNDVSSDHAASILQRCLPGKLHRALVLVTPRQVLRRAGRLCNEEKVKSETHYAK